MALMSRCSAEVALTALDFPVAVHWQRRSGSTAAIAPVIHAQMPWWLDVPMVRLGTAVWGADPSPEETDFALNAGSYLVLLDHSMVHLTGLTVETDAQVIQALHDSAMASGDWEEFSDAVGAIHGRCPRTGGMSS